MNFKNNLAPKLLILLITSLLIVSCNKGRNYKDSSRATGWKMNAKEGGFQYNAEAKEQETGPGLVFIEGGTFTEYPEPYLVDFVRDLFYACNSYYNQDKVKKSLEEEKAYNTYHSEIKLIG